MNIIILGAGQVGGTLAENLVREENNSRNSSSRIVELTPLIAAFP